jgi:hypothetical protein
MRTLELRTESDGGPQSNDRWFPLLFAGLGDRVVDASEVTASFLARSSQYSTLYVLVAVIYVKHLPTIG